MHVSGFKFDGVSVREFNIPQTQLCTRGYY